MKNYIAISTEAHTKGKIIGNTKQGASKGMNMEDFKDYIKRNTCESFEIKEMKQDYSNHRKFLNDKWVSAS